MLAGRARQFLGITTAHSAKSNKYPTTAAFDTSAKNAKHFSFVPLTYSGHDSSLSQLMSNVCSHFGKKRSPPREINSSNSSGRNPLSPFAVRINALEV